LLIKTNVFFRIRINLLSSSLAVVTKQTERQSDNDITVVQWDLIH